MNRQIKNKICEKTNEDVYEIIKQFTSNKEVIRGGYDYDIWNKYQITIIKPDGRWKQKITLFSNCKDCNYKFRKLNDYARCLSCFNNYKPPEKFKKGVCLIKI